MVFADVVDRDTYLTTAPWKPLRFTRESGLGKSVVAKQFQMRTLTGRREVRGVVLPSVGITSTMKDPLPTFATPEVIVRSVLKVEPLFGGEGGRHDDSQRFVDFR